jgi:hypothetical protein
MCPRGKPGKLIIPKYEQKKIERLQEDSDIPMVGSLRLNRQLIEDRMQGLVTHAIPTYILETPAWKWSIVLLKRGNPFSVVSRAHKVFSFIEKKPMTTAELVQAVADAKIYKGVFEHLLMVHEVLVQCVTAGLLIMDDETGILSVCKGKARPRRV